MNTTNYKGFNIQTKNGSSFIYQNGELKGCTHTDYSIDKPKDNSEEKAKIRIDNKKLNNIS